MFTEDDILLTGRQETAFETLMIFKGHEHKIIIKVFNAKDKPYCDLLVKNINSDDEDKISVCVIMPSKNDVNYFDIKDAFILDDILYFEFIVDIAKPKDKAVYDMICNKKWITNCYLINDKLYSIDILESV